VTRWRGVLWPLQQPSSLATGFVVPEKNYRAAA
jgi:hypothetical protein